MKTKLNSLFLLPFSCLIASGTLAQDIPYSYDVENSGSDCVKPPLPDPNELINYPMLPNPFAWSDGSGKVDTILDWECRRNEIKAEIENYEIGLKPDRPSDITASLTDNELEVVITENGQTLTLSSTVVIPEGEGPFPIVIGMNSGTGQLPAQLFDGVIQIPFMHNQVTTYYNYSNADAFFDLYPDQNVDNTGQYAAWSWGVSRLIDGIEIVKEQLNANSNIAVTGCSYAGKMALFSGAFDERITLTIAQESGGGGVNSWRVCETIGDVEKLGNTNYDWFKNSLKTDFIGKTGLLPYDHHELMAMCVPRALLVLGNPSQVWLGDESGYVASRAVEEVYKKFGIEDRFGFSFRTDHDHCQLPTESYAEVTEFVNKFLFNDEEANTDIHFLIDDFFSVDYNKWIRAWKEPADPNAPTVYITSPSDTTFITPGTITFETEVTDINNNVAKVIFYNKDQEISVDSIAPFSLTLTDMTPGNYAINAEVIDSQDLRGYSNFVTVTVKAAIIEFYKTDTPPGIDGNIDEVWNSNDIYIIEATNKLIGTDFTESDLSGTAKLLWDDSYVYVLAEVTDDVKKNDSQNSYEDDNIEIYFDIDNAKTTEYDANDGQFSFGWNDGSTIGVLPSGRSKADITYSLVDTETGYIAEIKFPWSTLSGLPEDGKLIGFDFMINDDDDGTGRDKKLSWNASADQAWQDASYFGTIKVIGTPSASANKKENLSAVSIYPNPAKGNLFVKGVGKIFDYQIIDISGELQLKGRSQNNIQIDNLSNGIYLLRIVEGDKLTNLKFIVE